MGLCHNSQNNKQFVHAELITWNKNPQGLFSFKDNNMYYFRDNFMITKNIVFFYDSIKEKIYFNSKDKINDFTRFFQKLKINLS